MSQSSKGTTIVDRSYHHNAAEFFKQFIAVNLSGSLSLLLL
jgi:hypothetical protein